VEAGGSNPLTPTNHTSWVTPQTPVSPVGLLGFFMSGFILGLLTGRVHVDLTLTRTSGPV